MTITAIPITAPATGRPQVRLLDASPVDLDEAQLRRWARAETAASDAPYTARSYRYPYALIAWHDQPVGVDIERIEPCSLAFAQSICTPAERADPAFPTYDERSIISLWCSKEALAKALGDATRYDPRRLESPMHWPDGRAGRWHAAALAVAHGHTAWLCWRTKST
jgi:phosphopantetheinyl transferase